MQSLTNSPVDEQFWWHLPAHRGKEKYGGSTKNELYSVANHSI